MIELGMLVLIFVLMIAGAITCFRDDEDPYSMRYLFIGLGMVALAYILGVTMSLLDANGVLG